jgi:hypothetical protein
MMYLKEPYCFLITKILMNTVRKKKVLLRTLEIGLLAYDMSDSKTHYFHLKKFAILKNMFTET